jgi:hypothetical protein
MDNVYSMDQILIEEKGLFKMLSKSPSLGDHFQQAREPGDIKVKISIV